MLTTTEAAALASVAPSTMKRWADQGVLDFVRTAGGHRRFERSAIERLMHPASGSSAVEDPLFAGWIGCLVAGRSHEIDSRLLEARSRLGSWCGVTDELGAVLSYMGTEWERGLLSIADEHVASNSLVRGLARVADALPTRLEGQRCMLACVGDDEHTLGLSLAELCLREAGWASVWLGRRTPVTEVIRLVRRGDVSLVALSASPVSSNKNELRAIATQVGSVCKDSGAGLIFGGAGAWPDHPSFGVRLTSFTALHDYLATPPHRWTRRSP